MNKFFISCKRCLNPWVVGLILLVGIGLTFFVPIIGVASLAVALPLIGCTVMCGFMAFFMKDNKQDKS